MPTPQTVVNNILCHIGAAVYILLLVSAVAFTCYQGYMLLKERKKKNA